MANTEQLNRLRQGVVTWNVWRADLNVPNLQKASLGKAPLCGANLSGSDLGEADLRDALLRKADLRKANLCGADLRGANLFKADLSGADLAGATLVGADLSEADLSGASLKKTNLSQTNFIGASLRNANLSGANLSGASLTRAHFGGANLSGVNFGGSDLSEVDLRGANLIDTQFDYTDLTNARLWETQRSGWSIKNITCRQVFWDRKGKESTKYEEGEFERIFAEKPCIVLHYPGGLSTTDLLALPLILQRLQSEHPECVLKVRSVQDDAGGASVTITVDDLAGREIEGFSEEVVRIKTKLECIVDERDRLQHRLDKIISLGIAEIGKFLTIPRIETHHHSTVIEGHQMTRHTYNIPGQAGAVGPGAHAHNNTFQQLQGSMDLSKLVEELRLLRNAMKSESIGARHQDTAIGAVADAEEAATKGDSSGALRYLKSAGTWALEIAEKIGVPLAIEYLRVTLS